MKGMWNNLSVRDYLWLAAFGGWLFYCLMYLE